MILKLNKLQVCIALLSAMSNMAMADEMIEASSFSDAITGGKFSGNLRLRWENVDQEGKSKLADAVTLRSLIGYETKPFHGFSVNTQIYGVSPFNDDYNDKKKGDEITSRKAYPVVADPEDYDFHQIYLQWANASNTVKLGRQGMILDNWRYIGDVRFRQNWAVFNGLSFVNSCLPKTTISLAHYEQVKDVTTKIHDANIEIANVKYALTPTTSISGYGYFIDWNGRTEAAKSNQTYGVRLDGSVKVNDQWKVLYTAEYAQQDDYKDGSDLIDNDYYRIGAGVGSGDWFVRVDQEKLSGNSDGKAFQTPLGTNHLFQGWADVFLSTPNEGIEDTMLIAGGKFMGATIKTEYHWIDSDRNFDKVGGGSGNQYGNEFDLGVYYPFTKQLTGSVEYANFKEDDAYKGAHKSDIQKIWVTTMYNF
ncbi:MAG: alginate export family protein [Methylophilaceae bacterium]